MRNTDLAYHPLVEERYPVLASALRDGLSANGKKFAAKYAAEFNVPGLAYGSVLDNRERSHCRPLYDSRIMFNGQPIALVVAETSEIAHFAASLVRVEYETDAHITDVYRRRELWRCGLGASTGKIFRDGGCGDHDSTRLSTFAT
jgi:hypothetical protein